MGKHLEYLREEKKKREQIIEECKKEFVRFSKQREAIRCSFEKNLYRLDRGVMLDRAKKVQILQRALKIEEENDLIMKEIHARGKVIRRLIDMKKNRPLEWAKDLKSNEEELKKAQWKNQSMFNETKSNERKFYPLRREWNDFCSGYIGRDKEHGEKMKWHTESHMKGELQKYKEEKGIAKCAELTRRQEELTEQIKTALTFFKKIGYRGDYPCKEMYKEMFYNIRV